VFRRPSTTWRRRRASIVELALALTLALASAPSTVRAQEPADTSNKAAAREFTRGERSFKMGDYVGAANAFEEAYRLSPHPDTLWNAARAWERAGEPVRAANLYAKYLAVAATDARDRGQVERSLAALASRLGRLEISAPLGAQVWVDRSPADSSTWYVSPGGHVVRIFDGERDESTAATVQAGRSVSVALAPPPPRGPVSPPAGAAVAPAPAPPVVSSPPVDRHGASAGERPARAGWSPVVVLVEGGLTVLATGFTVWSGLDTLAERNRFDSAPSRDRFDRGRAKQLRTNVAIGVSIALAAITAATALWLVDWRGDATRISVGVGAGSITSRVMF